MNIFKKKQKNFRFKLYKIIKSFINFLVKSFSSKIKNMILLIFILKIIIFIIFLPFIIIVWIIFFIKKSIYLLNTFFNKKNENTFSYDFINIENLITQNLFKNQSLIYKIIILLFNNREKILESLLEQEDKRKSLFILNQAKKLNNVSQEDFNREFKFFNFEELKVSNLSFFCNNNNKNFYLLTWDDILYPSDLENLQIKNINYSFNSFFKNQLLQKFYNKKISVKEIENLLNNKNFYKKEIIGLNSFLNVIDIDQFLEFENYKFIFLIELLQLLDLNKHKSIFELSEIYIKATSNFSNNFFKEDKFFIDSFYNLNFLEIKEIEVKENYIKQKSIKNFFTFDNDLKYHEYCSDDLFINQGDFMNLQYHSWSLFFVDQSLFLKREHGLDFFLLSPNDKVYDWIIKENDINQEFFLLEDKLVNNQLNALYQYYLRLNSSKNLNEKEWISDIQNDGDEPFYFGSQKERFIYKNFFYYNYTEIIFFIIFFIVSFILVNFDFVYLFGLGIFEGDRNVFKFFEKLSLLYFWNYIEILSLYGENIFKYFEISPFTKGNLFCFDKYKFFSLLILQFFYFFLPFSFFKYSVFSAVNPLRAFHQLFSGYGETIDEFDDLDVEYFLNQKFLNLYSNFDLSYKCFLKRDENHLLNLINYHLADYRVRFNKIFNCSSFNKRILFEYIRLFKLYPGLNLKTLLFVKYRFLMQNYFFEIFNDGRYDDVIGPSFINIFYFNYKNVIYERFEDINLNRNVVEIDLKNFTGNVDMDIDKLNKYLKRRLIKKRDYFTFVRSFLKGSDVLNTSLFFRDLRIYDFRNDQEVDITIEGNEELYKIFKNFYLTFYQKDKPEYEVDELWLLWRFIYYIHFLTFEGSEASKGKELFLTPEDFLKEKIFPEIMEKVIKVEEEALNKEYLEKLNSYNENKKFWVYLKYYYQRRKK